MLYITSLFLIFGIPDGVTASLSMDLRSNSSIDLFSPGVAVAFRALIFFRILSEYITLSIGFSFVDRRCWRVWEGYPFTAAVEG